MISIDIIRYMRGREKGLGIKLVGAVPDLLRLTRKKVPSSEPFTQETCGALVTDYWYRHLVPRLPRDPLPYQGRETIPTSPS